VDEGFKRDLKRLMDYISSKDIINSWKLWRKINFRLKLRIYEFLKSRRYFDYYLTSEEETKKIVEVLKRYLSDPYCDAITDEALKTMNLLENIEELIPRKMKPVLRELIYDFQNLKRRVTFDDILQIETVSSKI
jgi:hypothetical protein